MAEILKNTGAKLWSMVDDHDELQSNVFDQLFGTGGKSDIRLIDEAIGKINEKLDGYYFKVINDRLYICKDTESGITSLPVSITDDNGHTALKVDGTSITIDGNGVVHGATIDDAFSLTSENAVQNKVVKAKFDEVDGKIKANETTISSHKNDKNNPHYVTKEQVGLGNVEDKSSETIRGEITKDNVTTALGYTPYTPNEVDNKFSTLETNIDWKEAVDTFDDIATTYPTPEDGWTVNVKDTDYTYRYNGTEWVAISANAIPKATDSMDGLLSKEDHAKYDNAASKAHTHDNKTVLDGITSDKVSAWDNKVDKVEGKGLSSEDYTTEEKAKLDGLDDTLLNKLGESTEGNLTFNGTEINAAQMTGATTEKDGTSGTVPAPLAGQENLFLRGDGTWVEPKQDLSTYYNNANYSNNKLQLMHDSVVLKEFEIKSGGGISPQPMKSISVKYNHDTQYFEIKFTEPSDTIIDGMTLCSVEKIVLVRKEGVEPSDISDGDILLTLLRNDFGKYNKEAYVDNSFNPIIDVSYFYKAFPVSTDGVVNKLSENSVEAIAKNRVLYGFKIDQSESEPTSMITYLSDCDNSSFTPVHMDYTNDVFDYGDWSDAWFIRDLKPCMLKYDGTVDYELDKNDYTKKVDGTASDVANASYAGNVMVGIPKVYWKIVDNGDSTFNIYFCDIRLDDDFVCWSHIDNSGNEIDYCYVSAYDGILNNNVVRSISGKTPMSNQTATNEITYAKANNIDSDIIWYTGVYSDWLLINLLLYLIGKSTDTQTVFGTGNNSSYASTSNTGIKNTGTLNGKGLFYGKNDNTSCVKVFGIENFYGNIWKRIGGWINNNGTQKIKLTYGQSDGSTTDGYNTTGNGYISIANSTPSGTSGGYISKMIVSNNCLIPTVASGSATTYYCDGLWFNNSQVDYALVGGGSDRSSHVGALCVVLSATASAAYWDIGAALSCKPLA